MEDKIGATIGERHKRILQQLDNRQFYRELDLNYRHTIKYIYENYFKCGIYIIIGIERKCLEIGVEDQTQALLFKLKLT